MNDPLTTATLVVCVALFIPAMWFGDRLSDLLRYLWALVPDDDEDDWYDTGRL